MLVRRESGLALIPELPHMFATDAKKYRLESSSLMSVTESPPQEELAPAPLAAPPVPGQPGIVPWGPTEAPKTDHTALICIIIGFALVTVVAALIPFCVRRSSSQSGRDDPKSGSSRSRGRKGGYMSQRKGQRAGSSSESDEDGDFGAGGFEEWIPGGGYGTRRKERQEASGASSSRVDAAKRKAVDGQQEALAPHLDTQEETKEETVEPQAAKGTSYKHARANRKVQKASSSEALEQREQILQPSLDDEGQHSSILQTPLLASDVRDEDESSRAPSRSYKQDRATRKLEAPSGSSQISASFPSDSGGSEIQREGGSEQKTASSRYGAERSSRKAKAQEEPQ